MRLALAGSLVRPSPLILTLVNNTPFVPADYIDKGYTNFDVICIGGGGGSGGGINTQGTGTLIRSFGGAGGGGGLHRVQGLLSALPASCPVIVGLAGGDGTDQTTDPSLTTDGQDGGYSSFNDTTCQASGGRGGKRVQSNSLTISTDADGGQGGIGGRTLAGGGAIGGLAGTPTATGPGTPGTNGSDGTWNGAIGQGGGGGAGGVGKYGGEGITCNAATNGGKGSYNPGDLSVYGPGAETTDDSVTGSDDIQPGGAGGAKASPVNGLPYIYGRSVGSNTIPSGPGLVVIRLTAESTASQQQRRL